MTIQQAVNEFLIDQEIRGNSINTIDYYKRSLEYFMRFVTHEKVINDVKLINCKEYYIYLNQRDITTVSRQTYIRALRAFLTWCYNEGYIDVNISERFKLPRAQRKVIDVLTDDEINRLMNNFDLKTFLGLRNYCICALMLDSGLRLNEVVKLKIGSLHLSESYAIVDGKGNKQRFVPLGLNTKKALMKYLARLPFLELQTPLFVSEELIPIDYDCVKTLFQRLKKQSNIPRLHAHLLRHTFATRYLENGGDIYSLQNILGHSTLEMVKKYVHLTSNKMIVNFYTLSPLDKVYLKK